MEYNHDIKVVKENVGRNNILELILYSSFDADLFKTNQDTIEI
ncbi:hypothetical protein GCM10022393_28540 [Aquimarina addita]|uniref:Uncharacterized protein n=1 Tax=Aquimarina addita TaxID=870485 RepID=A0ABP6UQG6_9FLAO